MRRTGTALAVLLALGYSTSARALDLPLTVANPEATDKLATVVTSGIPFAQSVLSDANSVSLLRDGNALPLQTRITAKWPDGSVRWLLCDFQTDLPAGGTVALLLRTGTTNPALSGISIDDQPASLAVNTGSGTFSFNKNELALNGSTFTVVSDGGTYTAAPDAGAWVVEQNGPLKAVVRVDGHWFNGTTVLRDNLICFRARLFFYRNSPDAALQLTFRNTDSFGWENGLNKQPDLTITSASFGTTALLPFGSYVFGSGVEKTFEATVSGSGAAAVVDTRYNADGGLAAGYAAARPLAVCAPSYYDSTRAWGRVAPPLAGLPADRQPDFDLFEKLQRAKVNTADLEDPPGLTGITLFGHLALDLNVWNDYGDQRWAGDDGQWSGNHYDWVYGMYLQFMRTGLTGFANAARVMARHEIDFDIYHTTNDGNAYNRQKEWESRPSHNNPGNTFGGGRPTHTWCQGYALHWLLTGDPRGKDGYEEIIDGVRQYVYESFNTNGYCDTNEIRLQGWLTENLVTQWRIDPTTTWNTSNDGTKTIPQAIKDILQNVFDRETAAGGKGFVYSGGDPNNPDPNTRHPLQNCYFIEPGAKAYEEIFAGSDAAYAGQLLALLKRATRFLMEVTYGGTSSGGKYLPLQIPEYMSTPTARTGGQIPYLLMAANAAGFCYLNGGESDFAAYAPRAFRDYIRYLGVTGPDTTVDPSLRTATSYNSSVYVDTESKVHGWSSRYGMYYFALEQSLQSGTGGSQALSASVAPNPAKTGTAVSFGATTNPSTLTLAWDFGDGSASATGPAVTHTYNVSEDKTFTVTVTASGGADIVSQTLNVIVYVPASGGSGAPTPNTGVTVSNPVDQTSVQVLSSDGGVVQLQVSQNGASPPAGCAVATTFYAASGTFVGTAQGAQPVCKFTTPGIYVAAVALAGSSAGQARITLPISAAETGNPPATTPPTDMKFSAVTLTGKLLFKADKKDTVSFKGTFEMPAGLDLSKTQIIQVAVGNVAGTVTVDGKGKGTPATPVKSLSFKYLKLAKNKVTTTGQKATLALVLSAPQLDTLGFATEGLSQNGGKAGHSVRLTVQAALVFAGMAYRGDIPVNFKLSRKGDNGQFTSSR
ncbi:MAG: PKD domain-containing protein [Planctomycetota bacterium]